VLRFILAISLLMLSCGNSAGIHSGESPKYSSFREIPGVTQEEIKAIEALREKRTHFVYGMNEGTELFYGQNGEISGFTALFCEYLSHLFGIPFKPVLYGWSDLLAGLENGSIDFTGEMTATEERRKTYYMTGAIAERSIKYFRIKNSMSLEGIAEIRPLRYAFLEGTITVNDVSPFIGENVEIFFVSDYDKVHEMFKSGQIDAFFDESSAEAAFDIYDDVVAKDFLPLIYNPVSMSTQNPELEPIISVVQKMVQGESLRYLTEIYSKGHREYMKHKLFKYGINDEEREYILTHPVVFFAAEYDNYPISFYNTHENQWQGIAFDVLEEMEMLTGISFQRANDQQAEWPRLLKTLEEGKASIITELIPSKDRLERFLWPKNSLMQDKYALISKEKLRDVNINEVLHMKIGLFRGTAHTELFKTWFPNHPNTVEYENTEDAFEALERDEIEMVMASQNLLLVLTNYMELPGYKINILFDRSFESFFGLNKNEEILCSIIDKALEHMDVQKISGRWTRKTYDYRVKMAQSQLPWLVGVSILLLFVIVLLLVLYRRTRSEEKRLEDLVQKRTAELNKQYKLLEHISMTDQLTEIPNRHSFDSRLNLEWRRAMREKLPISFLMLDVDKFKIYNDAYGHQEGDAILKAVAKCIEQTVRRPGDLIARWGGEEFTVLLPNTNFQGALKVAEAIRSNIERSTVVTISIGVNTQIPEQNSSVDKFISAADNALYKAKEMGRNRVCATAGS